MVKYIIPIIVSATILFSIYFLGGEPFESSTINLNSETGYFKTGVYYYYKFSNDYNKYSKEFNPEYVLKQLLSNGIHPTDAWYKPYSSSCCPPGSKFCMEALVSPAFIVKLSKEDKRMLNFNFARTKNPDIGWCAYYVHHYIFNRIG